MKYTDKTLWILCGMVNGKLPQDSVQRNSESLFILCFVGGTYLDPFWSITLRTPSK